MEILEMYVFLAAVGLPGNLIMIYITAKDIEKITTAGLLIMHFSFANMMHLVARILTLVIPKQGGICYPVTGPCKVALFTLFCGRRVSMLLTLLLGVFRLMRLINRTRKIINITPRNKCTHVLLLLLWIAVVCLWLPYILLIPAHRTSHPNSTETCTCSILISFTDENDYVIKLFNMLNGTLIQALVVTLMFYVSIRIVLILRQHQRTVSADGALSRYRSNQRELNAIKGITALLVCFGICFIINTVLRNIITSASFFCQRLFGDFYPVASPYILGFGYQSFRNMFTCVSCNPCKKSNRQHSITVS
ncbi:uncharacterized protein LOC108705452 [Xenopus laevis]|uniref:Uncharacterized protein LOC108705452 n=1 Tax=Xenopus laevis TaxID=8355 RepID=A0A8J0U685_XENLA|nr:uncharacterized protein LOC108705452 [Xenopus laevis]